LAARIASPLLTYHSDQIRSMASSTASTNG
jgi:hypothetical protein